MYHSSRPGNDQGQHTGCCAGHVLTQEHQCNFPAQRPPSNWNKGISLGPNNIDEHVLLTEQRVSVAADFSTQCWLLVSMVTFKITSGKFQHQKMKVWPRCLRLERELS